MFEAFNLGAIFNAEHGAEHLALVDCRDWDTPVEYSHRDLDRAADACARGLSARGLTRGDAVAILSANRAEFLIAFLGTLRAGLVSVPVNHKFSPEIIAFVLEDADVRLVLCDAERARQYGSAKNLDRVNFDASGPHGFAALLDPGLFETVRPEDGEIAMVLYTSGSTGRPKGVPLTHAGHLWALRQRTARGWPFTQHRLLVAAPLYHMNALCVSLFSLAGCASAVLLPQFDARQYLQAIERFSCTWITSVPTMLAMCFQEQDVLGRCKLDSVNNVRMGSAPVSPKLLQQTKAAFPGANVMNGYGTTEAGPVVFGPRQGQNPPDLSVGWPAAGVDVKLKDEAGRESDQGVLWHRTPAVMPGYLNLPAKTQEVLTGDGWYISGDVFRRDADGAYYFVGRADDMFNCGGENIYPGEVEALLLSHEAVVQACVVAVADEIKGYKPVAFVVREAGSDIDEAQLKAHALANGPAYAHPRTVTFLDELPLAGPGKVDRRTLTDMARAASEVSQVE